MPTAATRALYRAFMHTARELERRKQPLLVQVPVLSSRVQWYKPGAPQSQYVPTAPSLREMLRERFPWLPDAEPRPDGDASRDLPSEELRRLIRQAFRRELDTAGSAEVDLVSSQRLDAAFSALRELHTQMELLRCSSATASEAAGGVRVRVEATSCYRGKQGPTGPWVFQYRVRIINEGDAIVRLLGREWRIRNADGSLHALVPRGSPGVVGETPTLAPGQAFEYASGTTLDQPGGSVEGCFQMRSHVALEGTPDTAEGGGLPFDAAVGRFECIVADGADGARGDAGGDTG